MTTNKNTAIQDNRSPLEVKRDCSSSWSFGDIYEALVGERVFTKLSREDLLSLVSEALQTGDKDAQYTALNCLRHMTSDELRRFEPRVSELASKNGSVGFCWVKFEAWRVMDNILTQKNKARSDSLRVQRVQPVRVLARA
ncbi:MAG: hypothetical protein PHU63_01045 [Candidatus ainarchaeum sp.]|nr:hypothetical protein [Candidatus ainarchaeum sp.]